VATANADQPMTAGVSWDSSQSRPQLRNVQIERDAAVLIVDGGAPHRHLSAS
jgi:hypothetical protein